MPPKKMGGFQKGSKSFAVMHRVWQQPIVLRCFALLSFSVQGSYTKPGDRPETCLHYSCLNCKLEKPIQYARSKFGSREITKTEPFESNKNKHIESAISTMLTDHASCHPDLPSLADLKSLPRPMDIDTIATDHASVPTSSSPTTPSPGASQLSIGFPPSS